MTGLFLFNIAFTFFIYLVKVRVFDKPFDCQAVCLFFYLDFFNIVVHFVLEQRFLIQKKSFYSYYFTACFNLIIE